MGYKINECNKNVIERCVGVAYRLLVIYGTSSTMTSNKSPRKGADLNTRWNLSYFFGTESRKIGHAMSGAVIPENVANPTVKTKG